MPACMSISATALSLHIVMHHADMSCIADCTDLQILLKLALMSSQVQLCTSTLAHDCLVA